MSGDDRVYTVRVAGLMTPDEVGASVMGLSQEAYLAWKASQPKVRVPASARYAIRLADWLHRRADAWTRRANKHLQIPGS
jgi:uncharacterized protein (DUF934 family)